MKRYISILILSILILPGCTTSNGKPQSSNSETQPNQNVLPELQSTEKETSTVSHQDLEGLDKDMKRIVEFLSEYKMVHMATVGSDGKPFNRTIQFQFFKNGRIYFQTDTNASLYGDLKKLPFIELVANNNYDTQSLRIRGEVVFEYNRELLERVLLEPNIKKIYGSADNPTLTMFYIDHATAQIFEFSDQVQGTTLAYAW